MKFAFYILCFIITVSLISCNGKNGIASIPEAQVATKDTTPQTKGKITKTVSDSIVKNLQGKWREEEYPFRTAHFKNTTVKITDEGVVEEPAFREFTIADECPFEVNNLKNARVNDLFLVMVRSRTCEVITVSNNTLTLSGFNVSSSSIYKIVYKKVG